MTVLAIVEWLLLRRVLIVYPAKAVFHTTENMSFGMPACICYYWAVAFG